MIGNHLGDNRMLVSGGLLDQPYHLWQVVQHVRWVWDLLERWADRTDASRFSPYEVNFMRETVDKARGIKR